jgi:hypothetical protein
MLRSQLHIGERNYYISLGNCFDRHRIPNEMEKARLNIEYESRGKLGRSQFLVMDVFFDCRAAARSLFVNSCVKC